MQTSPEDLRRHYASLSDEALLDIDPSHLTEAAQQVYESELAERGLLETEEEPQPAGDSEAEQYSDPDWLEDAACVCSFDSQPDGAHDAGAAYDALCAAGIPCEIVAEELPADGGHPPRKDYRVLVPGPLTLSASSVLDKEIFNAQLESTWRAHFNALSDQELRALNPEMLCAGFADRIARLKAVYRDEVARRRP